MMNGLSYRLLDEEELHGRGRIKQLQTIKGEARGKGILKQSNHMGGWMRRL